MVVNIYLSIIETINGRKIFIFISLIGQGIFKFLHCTQDEVRSFLLFCILKGIKKIFHLEERIVYIPLCPVVSALIGTVIEHLRSSLIAALREIINGRLTGKINGSIIG
jgi:hypothetical protein